MDGCWTAEAPLTNPDTASVLEDDTKRIPNDISWAEDEDHSPALEFRTEIETASGWPLFVKGRYNPDAETLTYALILRTTGRIYALDLGKDHHNPQCEQVGERHKHRWTEQYRDKEAYMPDDVTAPVTDPVAVWRQFCAEAGILHDGAMAPPPPVQVELW